MYEIAHIGVVVKDAELSSKFYSQVLGCKVCDQVDTAELKLIFLKSGSQIIELVEYAKDTVPNRAAGVVDHIAFIVPDMNAAIENLRSFNVPLLFDTPKVLSDKIILFFSGPDGERLEFIQMLHA